MNNEHDQVANIARIVCRYCLANRGLFTAHPYKEMFPTTQKIEKTYQFLYLMGGRKRFTEPKQSALLRGHLFTPDFFQIVASNIELMCRFNGGIVKYWNGKGARKDMCIEAMAEGSKMLEELGLDGAPNPFMEYQVDITNIWNEISPYLES